MHDRVAAAATLLVRDDAGAGSPAGARCFLRVARAPSPRSTSRRAARTTACRVSTCGTRCGTLGSTRGRIPSGAPACAPGENGSRASRTPAGARPRRRRRVLLRRRWPACGGGWRAEHRRRRQRGLPSGLIARRRLEAGHCGRLDRMDVQGARSLRTPIGEADVALRGGRTSLRFAGARAPPRSTRRARSADTQAQARRVDVASRPHRDAPGLRDLCSRWRAPSACARRPRDPRALPSRPCRRARGPRVERVLWLAALDRCLRATPRPGPRADRAAVDARGHRARRPAGLRRVCG